jgi:hypothetical protein
MRPRTGLSWIVLFLLVSLPAFAVDRPPRLDMDRGMLVVSGLPDILSRPEVRPHLSSGLTTTFVIQVSAADGSGKKLNGGATIAVRYEPWDEVFLVVSSGVSGVPGGTARKESLPTFEGLAAWWREQRLPVLTPTGLAGGSWQVKVAVHVVPFSESERENTQRWFAQSVGGSQRSDRSDRSNAEDASAAAKESTGPGMVLDLLVATSIRRRSLVSYDWTLTFKAPGSRH